jgi:hypothetical protein
MTVNSVNNNNLISGARERKLVISLAPMIINNGGYLGAALGFGYGADKDITLTGGVEMSVTPGIKSLEKRDYSPSVVASCTAAVVHAPSEKYSLHAGISADSAVKAQDTEIDKQNFDVTAGATYRTFGRLSLTGALTGGVRRTVEQKNYTSKDGKETKLAVKPEYTRKIGAVAEVDFRLYKNIDAALSYSSTENMFSARLRINFDMK